VEALARRVSRGDILPETPLFDAGTGAWSAAGQAQVVRFILEQIQEEGSEMPSGWLAGFPTGDGANQEAPPHEPAEFPGPASLGFTFTLADMPEAEPDGVPDFAQDTKVHDASSESPPIETLLEATWEAGEVDAPTEKLRAATSEDSWTPDDSAVLPFEAPPTFPWKEPAPAGEGRSEVDWVEVDARRDAAARRRGLGFAVLIVAGLVVGGSIILGDGFGVGEDTSAAPESPEAVALDPGPAPVGLETRVEEALARFDLRIQETVDSLRDALALPEAPPREWLGGYYMANAREFPELREFWVSYRTFVESLRSREGPVLGSVLSEGNAVGDAEASQELVTYVTARYEWKLPARQDRYDRLILAATRAVEFHDFLVASESGLRYTPAVGPLLPNDPVLEIAATDPKVHAELNARLDGLLAALDRSRGGALPNTTGLGPELYSGFGGL
jgi:hypothetical protein